MALSALAACPVDDDEVREPEPDGRDLVFDEDVLRDAWMSTNIQESNNVTNTQVVNALVALDDVILLAHTHTHTGVDMPRACAGNRTQIKCT